jgi:hypothetical protein
VFSISCIIIDGYNLIGIQHNDLGREREKLVRLLSEYKKIRGHDITVVFDGWKDGRGKEATLVTGGVKVIYSGVGEKADSLIKRIIGGERKEWIVISSDREIESFAWSKDSVPVPSALFASVLENIGNSFSGAYEPLYEDEEPLRKKGSPRKLSKKEKILQRALRRL